MNRLGLKPIFSDRPNLRLFFISSKTLIICLAILLNLLFSSVRLIAAGVDEEFEQANRLYEQGRYTESAQVYEKIIKSGRASAAIYFNWGNALFKSGKIGMAIYAYLNAERLAPRDPDIKANLEFARKAVSGGAVLAKKNWTDIVRKLTLNEWAILFAITFWGLFIMLALCQWNTQYKNKLRFPIKLNLVLLLIFGFCLGLNAYERITNRIAIVIVPEGIAHQGPLDESPKKFPIRDGLEFTIVDKKGEWLQVVDNSNRIGWVKTNDVVLLPRW